jgi:hypothetical protein
MTNREILVKRKTLERDIQRANANSHTFHRERVEAERALPVAEGALDRARMEVGRGVLGIDIPALAETVEQAQTAVADTTEQYEANKRGEADLANQLRKWLADNMDVFTVLAEKSTTEAHDALQHVHEAVATAQRAWQAAGEAWKPLVMAGNLDDLRRFPKLTEKFPAFPIAVTQTRAGARPEPRAY